MSYDLKLEVNQKSDSDLRHYIIKSHPNFNFGQKFSLKGLEQFFDFFSAYLLELFLCDVIVLEHDTHPKFFFWEYFILILFLLEYNTHLKFLVRRKQMVICLWLRKIYKIYISKTRCWTKSKFGNFSMLKVIGMLHNWNFEGA